MSGQYNKYAGNQAARDFFWFYFSSIFPMKVAGGRIHSIHIAREIPSPHSLMTALLISHSFARESTEHLTGCGKKIWKFCGNVKTYYMQKIASHCKLICSQIDKTVSSTNISGMLFCCKKKVNQGWQNCCKKQQCILFLGLWLKACVTTSWLCCDCS